VFMLFLPRSILTIVLASQSVSGPARQPVPTCDDAVHHQLDFWLGDWDVFTPDGKPAGRSHIASFANGCGIEEQWTGAGGGSGRSLNTYDASDHKWHQFWVGAGGSVLQLAGGFADNVMTLENPSNRIRFTHNADGTVRQTWDISADGGKTWKTTFDGKYVRSHAPPGG